MRCESSITDVTVLVRARRWCGDAAMVGQVLAGFVLLGVLFVPPWRWVLLPILLACVVASLAASFGSLLGALVLTALTITSVWAIGSEIFSGKLAEPSAVIVWIGGATVVAVFALLLAGVAASFVYQHHLPPLPSRRSAAQLPIGKLLAAMRSKRRRAGLALQAAGALLLLGCLAPGLLTLAAPRTIGDLFVSGEGMIAYLVAFAPMVIGAYAAFARGKRLAAEALLVARRRDQRPPILFLRSFGDDRRPIRRALPLSRMQPSDFFRGVWTLEEALERDLARLGSVVAIGRPGEELPPAGAAREYVADDVWKDRVTELLDGAALVAVVAGETEGLALEYRTIAARGALSRLVLILPDPRPVQHLKQVDALLRGDTSPVARHFTGGSSMSPYGRIP